MTADVRDERIADLLALLDDANVREQQAIARAGRAEAECDEWRQVANDERGAALDALNTIKDRDARIQAARDALDQRPQDRASGLHIDISDALND